MQVHPEALASRAAQDGHGSRMLPSSNPQVDVAVRAQATLRVESRCRPALGQQRLHAGRTQERDGAHDAALVQPSLERMETVRLAKLEGGGAGPQIGIAHPPPA